MLRLCMFYYIGPEGWSKYFPTCGKKNRQSPINLNLSSNQLVDRDTLILYHNYFLYPYAKYSLVNTGHSLQVNLPGNTYYRLIRNYNVWIPMQLHLHYSTTNEMGSEHKVNGKKYQAEVRVFPVGNSWSNDI